MDWLHSTWGSLEEVVVAAGRMSRGPLELIMSCIEHVREVFG